MIQPTQRLALANSFLFTCCLLLLAAFAFHTSELRDCSDSGCQKDASALYWTFTGILLFMGLISLLITAPVVSAFQMTSHTVQECLVYTWAMSVLTVGATQATVSSCLGTADNAADQQECIDDRETNALYGALCVTATPIVYWILTRFVAALLSCGGSGGGLVPRNGYSTLTHAAGSTLGVTGLLYAWASYRYIASECGQKAPPAFSDIEECYVEQLAFYGIMLAMLMLALVVCTLTLLFKCATASPFASGRNTEHGRVIFFSLVFGLVFFFMFVAQRTKTYNCLHSSGEDESAEDFNTCLDEDDEEVDYIGFFAVAFAFLLMVFGFTWGRTSGMPAATKMGSGKA